MRSISKGSEPPVLADARRTATLDGRHITGDDWPPAGPGGTQDIRDALYAEQAGLCAYCCSRIRANQGADGVQIPPGNRAVPGAGGMCIEHWMPRHGYPDSDESEREACGRETLSWENLLGVCVGVSIGPDQESQSHCDHARGNARLAIHPARTPQLSKRFAYNKASGRMTPTREEDTQAAADIETLNLNAGRLCANRHAVIRKLRQKLRQDDSRSVLLRLWRLATDPQGGVLQPFAPVAERYLERKLRARGMTVIA